MPYSRRRNTRRKGSRKSYSSAPRALTTAPRKEIVKLRYSAQLALDPSALVPAVHVVSANGMYDPDITGLGHQPRGFDQWMTMYDHYTVIGSKINVTLTPNNADTVQRLIGIALVDNATPLDYNSYMESQRRIVRGASNGASAAPTTLSFKCKPHEFLGTSKPLSDAQLKGSAIANPLEGVYFHIFVQSPNGGNPGFSDLQITVDYLAVLTEFKLPAQS